MKRRLRFVAVCMLASLAPACSSGGAAAPPGRYVAPPAAGGFTFSPAALTFATTPAAQSVVVSESGYSGTFTPNLQCKATSGNGTVASVSPPSAAAAEAGAPVAFSVSSGTSSGTCTLTIADAAGHAIAIPVDATFGSISPIALSTNSLALTVSVSPTSFSASEPNYGGTASQFFRAVATCAPANAVVLTSSAYAAQAGAPAVFSITASAPGTCSVAVSDQYGQTQQLAVTIARAVTLSPATLVFTDGNARNVTASESGITAFSIGSTSCGGLVSIEPASGSSSNFVVTPTAAGLSAGADCTATFSDGAGGTGALRIYVNSLSIGVY